MSNSLAMTALLILFGLAGQSVMAADTAIVQGATLALFYALSANARNLILNKYNTVPAGSIVFARMLLLIPIAGIAFVLSTSFSGVNSHFAMILILRRSVEWLGEVHLSEMERLGDSEIARHYLIAQIFLLILAILWILTGMPLPLLGLFLWALLPLLFSLRFIFESLQAPFTALQNVWQKLLPHIGSTTVIGVTVYVFRLLIILMVGKTVAGDLFTAYALGGVFGSIFASAFGPSFALHENRSGARTLPSLIRFSLFGTFVLGSVLFIISACLPELLFWTAKSILFWKGTGLSMIGGVVMVHAQIIRNRFLQQHKDSDVFGPDVLMNILVIAAVPFTFYLFGEQSMSGLFLFNAVLAFVFYWNCEKDENESIFNTADRLYLIRIILPVAILLPLFFQMSGFVFRSPIMIYESRGILANLPIPLSVFACFVGIPMIGSYQRAIPSLKFLFLTFILMVTSTIIISHGHPQQGQAKLILLIQFILPMFAIFLGQIIESTELPISHYIEKAFLYTLLIMVPFQLLCTLIQNIFYLTAYLYLFSIYQHIQYVPVIFVSAYLISLYTLWPQEKQRRLLIFLTPLMGIYSAASLSRLTPFLLLSGFLIFAIYKWVFSSEKLPVLLFLILSISYGGYVFLSKDDPAFSGKIKNNADIHMSSSTATGNYTESYHQSSISVKLPDKSVVFKDELNKLNPNTLKRMDYWRYYLKYSTSSTKNLLLGNLERPDRSKLASAHNYYLDFIHNFGLLAIIPFIVIIGYTVRSVYNLRHHLYNSPELLGLVVVVFFLIFIDNFLKVGFRQPYPGIFSYFVWGVLLSRLASLSGKVKNAV